MTPIERTTIQQQITTEYRKHQDLTDQTFIRQCLVQAEYQYNFLESGVSPTQSTVLEDGQDKWDRAGGPDKDDVLGRTGKGWPWGEK